MSRRLLFLLLFIFLSTLATVASVRFFVSEPQIDTVSQEQQLVGTGLYKTLGEMYLDSLRADPHSIEYHQKMQLLYPAAHPDIQRKVDNFYDSISTFYHFESEYLYSIGFRYSKEGYHDSAAFYYAQIEKEGDEDLSFLSHSQGYAYLKMGEYKKAEAYLLKSIDSGASTDGVYVHLAKLYHITRQYEKLDSLLAQEGMADIIPEDIQRITFIKKRDYTAYIHSFIEMNFTGFIWEGIVAAALIALVWMGFLLRVSLFKKQNLPVVVLFFVFGALFSTLCTFLYDFYNIGFGVEVTGNYLQDFLFCILGIGLVEESLKVVPLFILLFIIRKRHNEPITLLILGSVSAVGFAFMENLIYFDIYGLKSIFGRSLTSSVLHMGLTALPVYGVQKALLQRKGGVFAAFFRYFFIAVVIHGLYDFFLSADKVLSDFKVVSILIWIILLLFYRAMIQNLLNLSPFFVEGKEKRLRQSGYYLGYMLYTVFLVQFVFMANRFGSSITIVSLPGSIVVYSYLLLLMPLLFGTMKLYKGYTPSLLMLGKRSRPPRRCTSAMKRHYANQWKEFRSEHQSAKLSGNESKRVGYRDLLILFILLLCTSVVLSFALRSNLGGYGGSLVVLLGGVTLYRFRLLLKRWYWSIRIDMATETMTLAYGRKIKAQLRFSDVYYLHNYGPYKELLLYDRRVLLDRTLFENFEIETFFLYFESYLIAKEDDPVEFHMQEEELQEFAIPTVLYPKSLDSVTDRSSS